MIDYLYYSVTVASSERHLFLKKPFSSSGVFCLSLFISIFNEARYAQIVKSIVWVKL